MPTAPDLRKKMKLWHFLKVLQNSWNLQNLLESPPRTCIWNLRQFGEVTIFDRKMPTAPDLRKRMKLWHFLKVLQNSWNLQNLLESLPETCMWNFRLFGEVTIFDSKMPTAPDLRKRMKLWHFLKVLQNSWNLQNLLESLPETCKWNLRLFGEVTIFDRKIPTAPDLRKRMKLWHFLKVLQNSWNLQNLLDSLPETCMWNLRLFGEVTIFDSKMPTAPDLRKKMKLWHFLKVLQNSWNLQNLLESPPRTCIWNLRQFGEVTIFDSKMPTAPDRIYWNHLQEHASEIWGSLEKLQFLTEKCRQRQTLEKGWNYDIFSKFSKIHETYRIYWNHYQKHACEIWGCLEKLKFLTVKCLQRRTLEKRWNYDIFSKFSKIHETYRIYWNHLQEHASEIWGSLEKLQFLTEKCRQRRTLEKGWNYDIFSKFSKIHETYRIYWNHYQKHACEIWGCLEKLKFLTVKCLQRRTLEKGWNYDIFSKFSKIHETYRIYWNHLQEHASEIWGSLEKLQFLTEKCRQRRTLEKGWNYDIFSKFSKIHETYRIYWNHYQKHACEIWGCLEKLKFLTVKCLQRRTLEKDEIMTFSQSSPKFIKLTEFIGITSKNMHLKFEAVWRSYNFWQKNADSAGP